MTDTHPVWTTLEARVDYWSGTTDDMELGEWAHERAVEYIQNDRLGDLTSAGTSIQGYFGVGSQHAFSGQSECGTYVRFSSADAGDRWTEFCRAGLRTSRIDLCVTNQSDIDVPSVAYAIRYGPRLPARIRGKSPRVEFVSKEGGGDTAYVGSGATNRRGRVYDKGREEPANYELGAWRWEVQLRHEPGNACGRYLAGRDRHSEWISSYVQQWFSDRGIYAPWSPAEAPTSPKTARVDTDDLRRMTWLKTSVAPMIERMLNRYSKRELRRVLGLQYTSADNTRTRLTRDQFTGS